MKNEEFEEFLKSIGGLYGRFTDRPPITSNLCECNDGWLQIISECIQELIAAGWDKHVFQIKEKFGGLRFYVDKGSEEIWKIISKYEKISMETCEVCGSNDQAAIRSGSWLKCLCNKHAEGRSIVHWVNKK